MKTKKTAGLVFKPLQIRFKGRQKQVYEHVITSVREAVYVIDNASMLRDLRNELQEVIAIASMLEYRLKNK